MLSSLAPARRRLVLAVVAVAALGVIAAVVAVVVNRDEPAHPVSQATAGPVLIIPGYGGSTTSPLRLATALRARGKEVTVVPLIGNGTGDLDAQAVAFGHAVDTVLREDHAASVDVIGYSAGGVVARLWVRDHGGASLARHVVTLGSPHHGTDVATLAGSTLPGACPTACRQLAEDSDLLTRLNAGDETPAGPQFVSIWTTHDDIVLPADSAVLEGAVNVRVQSVCPTDAVRHQGLPIDPNVQSMILAELAAGPPRALTAVDCGRPAA